MRTTDPQLTFADLEFLHQGVHLDPRLQAISQFLEQHAEIIEMVRPDLQRGLKKPLTGRSGLTPAQVLRSLILMRVKNWDYRELRERINDGYTLRRFTDFDSQPVPQHDAFHRAFLRLTPQTLLAINRAGVQAAVDLGLEDGSKLRVDTTVSETNIHYPTDATLLWDSVRVLTRLVGDLHEKLPHGVTGFANRTRSARRRMQQIQRMTSPQRQEQQVPKYRQLIQVTEQVVANAREVVQKTEGTGGSSLTDSLVILHLQEQIQHFCQLADRVVDQTRRRVLLGEQVPSQQKIYSIFEPHTDLIKRGKAQKPVEFGHKVFLAESAQGLITDYRVLDGNPSDEDQVQPSLDRHQQTFGCAPDLYGADRGFYSKDNVQRGEQAGVREVCIPQRGGTKTPERKLYEKSPAFRKGQRFRAGIEGRISVLLRGRGMKRCLAQGRQRFEVFVGAAVLTNNLMRIAELLKNPSARPPANHGLLNLPPGWNLRPGAAMSARSGP